MALSISASLKTIKGALPPSSSESFLMSPAHCCMRMEPTRVEPVNVSLRTLVFSQSSLPISAASDPVTIFNTPLGIPARSPKTAMAVADNGVSSAGRPTNVQPDARAGATFRAIIAFGKFHGVIEPTTPIGCFKTKMRLSRWWPGITSPSIRRHSSANQRKKLAP